jgi:hypothetical protein
MPRSSPFQVRHGDIDHGREAKNVHGNRLPLRLPFECWIVEAGSGTDDEEFYIAQFFDEFSQKRHGQLGLGHIDRLDHAGTRQLRLKPSQQIGAPRNDADAKAIV